MNYASFSALRVVSPPSKLYVWVVQEQAVRGEKRSQSGETRSEQHCRGGRRLALSSRCCIYKIEIIGVFTQPLPYSDPKLEGPVRL